MPGGADDAYEAAAMSSNPAACVRIGAEDMMSCCGAGASGRRTAGGASISVTAPRSIAFGVMSAAGGGIAAGGEGAGTGVGDGW